VNQQVDNNRPIGVDLFAGAGGMSLGFESAGFDVLAAVEIDPIHCATHQFNLPFCSVICQNIINLTAADIRNFSTIGDREIDVVFGGAPCQGFSLIGKRMLDDPRNSLIFHFIRLVLELNPKYFVFENVKGITTGKHRKFVAEMIDAFEQNGYAVRRNFQVLNAANYGVPQKRERFFLLGCRQDCQLPAYPQKTSEIPNSKNFNQATDTNITPTVWEALKDLPEVEFYEDLKTRDWAIAEFGKPSNYGRMLRNLLPIDDDYSYQRIYNPQILTSSLRTQHTPESIARFESTPHGKTESVSRFHKLDPNGLCHTLRAGTPTNRGAYTAPRPIHPFTPRCITTREAARLHSYPDWFRFHVTKWHGFRQIGNSVPPLLAKAVASEIIRSLQIFLSKPQAFYRLENAKLLELNMAEAADYYHVNRHVIEPRTRTKKESYEE
jgi:DNA (cytosine-5)-methyltransferase 1